MDLKSILEKSKQSPQQNIPEPAFIATTYRPYDLPSTEKLEEINKDFKEGNKGVTKEEQKGNKRVTYKNNNDNKGVTKEEQKGNKRGIKRVTKISFSLLTGLQRAIAVFIYHECKKLRSKITDPLTREYIAIQLNSDKNTIKTSILRLEEKKIIRRVDCKIGRGGWLKFELFSDVYDEIFQCEESNNLVLKGNKWVTKRVTNPNTSSSIYINTTTTELPNEWQKINISPLESIGFTMGHLTQLQKTGISSAEFVQDSIDHFGYDLVNNNKVKEIKTNPIGYFMGIMKRVGVYTAPDNYESEKDRSLRLYLETKKQQHEKQVKMEAELLDLLYNEWVFDLTEDERKQWIPEHIFNGNIEGAKIAALKAHFKKNVWPEKSKKIM